MSDLIFNCLIHGGKDFNKLTTMQQIETQMFVFFMEINNNQFKWNGLPKGLKQHNLEKILNFYGQAVVFRNNDELIACSCATTSLLDIYGEPTNVQPIALNGMSFPVVDISDRPSKNGVRIRNNLMSIPTYFMIKPFIDKLCFIWESMGINAGLSRIKYLIHANKQLAGTIKTEIKKIVGGKDIIPVVNEKVNVLKEIEKLDFNVSYNPSEYWEDFDKTFALICQLCGITTNLSQNKKERLIVSEVESNDELTTLTEDTRLEFRKLGCEEVNELFGESWSVDNKIEDVKITNPNDNKDIKQEDIETDK